MTNPPNRYRPHRSALYLPASNPRAIEKARQIDADAIIFDLEDAVAPQAKQAARENLVRGLATGTFGRSRRVIRVNGMDTPYFKDDLQILAQCRPDAVLLPKVSDGETVAAVAEQLERLALSPAPGIWAMIETPAALLNLPEIASAGQAGAPQLECLVAGTNDLAKETGVSTGKERVFLVPWLMQIVLVARRFGLVALDGVWNDFRDTAGYEREARQSRDMGFDGKTLIHPSQVDYINDIHTPSAEALAEARQVVEEFSRPENAGAGVISVNGRMVELLHLEMARRLLALDAAMHG